MALFIIFGIGHFLYGVIQAALSLNFTVMLHRDIRGGATPSDARIAALFRLYATIPGGPP